MQHSKDETRSFPKQSAEVSQLADRFTEAFRCGKQPSIEAYLDEYRGDRMQLLRELLQMEFRLREEAGEDIDLNEYFLRFPDSQPVVKSAFSDYESDPTGFDQTKWGDQPLTGEFGDYRLVRKIGQGGMGIVYEAEQKSLGNRRLAFKTIKHAGDVDDRVLRRFKTEVEAVAQLEHRHIVPVYHVGEEAGIHFYVMKFIDGNNLRELFKTLQSAVSSKKGSSAGSGDTKRSTPADRDSTPITSHQSGWSKGDTLASNNVLDIISRDGSTANSHFVKGFARMGIQVAEALHHAHQQGVIHRDIKPANLLMDVDGDVWLTDFGLATIRDKPDFTAPGSLVGTYHYMSPEQAMGSKRVIVDHRTDIYSLGVTLYELLTLRRAFPGHSREEILRSVQFECPPPVRQVAPRVPMDLETIVMKAMAKTPNARFQSAEEMATELQRFLDGKPLSIRPPSVFEKLGYWARSNRQAVTSIAAVCLVVFIAAIVSSFLLMQQQAKTQAALDSEKQQKAVVEQQKDDVTRLLQQSDGLRLAANSLLQVQDDPTLALRLAIESAKLHSGSDANDAIMRALDLEHEAKTLSGHTAPVGHVAFDQDGSKLVSSAQTFRCLQDNLVNTVEPAIVWDTDTGESLGKLTDERTITSAVFSPDNALILTAASPDEMMATNDVNETLLATSPSLWDATSNRKLVTFEDAFLFKAHQRAFSPDGLKIVLPITGNQAAVFFCAGTKLVTLSGHTARVVFAAFNPQGDRVVTYSDDNSVRVWDANTGDPILSLTDWQQPGVAQQPRDLTWAEFTPDGRRLAIGSQNRGIELRDLENNGVKINADRIPGSTGVFHGNGDLLATHGGEDAGTMKRLAIRSAYDAHRIQYVAANRMIRKVVISPNSQFAGFLSFTPMTHFRLWNLKQHKLVGTFGSGTDPINDLVFSPDSNFIATASNDNSVRLWHVRNGRDRATFATVTHQGRPLTATSPDGKMFSVASMESAPVGALCDFSAAEQATRFDAKLTMPFPGGKRFLASNKGRLAIHSIADGSFLGQETLVDINVKELAINLSGNRVAAYSEGANVVLWDPENNHRLLLPIGDEHVKELHFSPNGEQLFALCNDGNLRVWEADDGTLIKAIDGLGKLIDIDFSRDGKRIAVAADGNAPSVFDADTLEPIQRLGDAVESFDQVRLSFDGTKIVTYREMQSKSIIVWDVDSGTQDAKLDIDGSVGVAMHPTEQEMLVWSSKDGAQIWRYEEDQQLPITEERVGSGAYSNDGKQFYLGTSVPMSYGASRIDAWPANVTSPKVTRWIRDGIQEKESINFPMEMIERILISDLGQVYVAAFQSNQVETYEVSSRERISTIPGHFALLSQCLYTSDSTQLFTTSWDGTVSTWNVADGSLLHNWNHGSPILSAAISGDDNYLITGARDGSVRIWDLGRSTSVEPVSKQMSVSESPIWQIAFAPDSNQVLALSSDNKAHLVERESGKITAMDFQTESVAWAEYSPDGKSILVLPVAAPEDETHFVQIVSVDKSAVTKIEYPATIQTSHFHPDSDRIVTATRDGIVWINNTQTREIDHQFDLDAGKLQSAEFDTTGEYLFVNELNNSTIFRVSDGPRWLTLEDTGVVHPWHHTRYEFLPGQPRRVLTRRFDRFQFRVSPLTPMSATSAKPPRQLSESEEKRFLNEDVGAAIEQD